VLYAEALADLTTDEVQHGFRQALRLFKPEYGKTFPTPAELREWAEEAISPDENRKAALESDEIDPEKCPAGWTPEEVKRARITMRVIRQQAAKPLPLESGETGDENGDYAEQFRQAV